MTTNALRAKAVLDRIVSVVLIVSLLPVAGLIAIAIAVEAMLRGEAPTLVFAENRLSRGRRVQLFKFRIMTSAALKEELLRDPLESVRLAERRGGRLTAVGRVLARTHLHHLPQLVNVLRGDISLVGPRPFSVREWADDPRVRIEARQCLKAGWIGPYQSKHGATMSATAAEEGDTKYFEFVSQASASGVIAEDLAILSRAAATFARTVLRQVV